MVKIITFTEEQRQMIVRKTFLKKRLKKESLSAKPFANNAVRLMNLKMEEPEYKHITVIITNHLM